MRASPCDDHDVSGWIGALVLVLIVVGVVVYQTAGHRRRAESFERRLSVRIEGQPLDRRDAAFCYGLDSDEERRLRGSGTLVLTREYLHFFEQRLGGELRVPRRSLIEVDAVQRQDGSRARPAVRVAWTNADGRSDAAVWEVPDVELWMALLRAGR